MADASVDPARPPRRAARLRRLAGVDRSGPAPPETLAGAPLRPWTIPNAIGYVRVAGIAGFVVLALSSDDGTDALATTIFWLVAWGDQLDGLAARLSGQYSRLGALMDPVIDRLLVLAGVVVCWHFELLPRWALAILLAREALMVVLGPVVLRRGHELRITMLGRLAVWPTMGAILLALWSVDGLDEIMLYAGLVMTLGATLQYARQLST